MIKKIYRWKLHYTRYPNNMVSQVYINKKKLYLEKCIKRNTSKILILSFLNSPVVFYIKMSDMDVCVVLNRSAVLGYKRKWWPMWAGYKHNGGHWETQERLLGSLSFISWDVEAGLQPWRQVRARDGIQTGVPRASGPENEVADKEGPQGPPTTTGASYRDVVS